MGRETRRVAASQRDQLVTLLRSQPLHQQECGFLVLGVLRNADAKATGLAATARAHRVQRPADLADDLGLRWIVDLSRNNRSIQEHGSVAVQECAQCLAKAEVLGTFRTAIHDGFQRVGGFHTRFVVHDRVPGVVKDAPPQRRKVQQKRMRGVMARCGAR